MSDYKTGQDNLAKAKSYTKTSVFSLRFSPEWESVQRHSRRAIESFKMCGPEAHNELLESYQLAVQSFEHTGSYQQCGVYSDEAGDLSSKMALSDENAQQKKELVSKAVAYHLSAAKYFRLQGNLQRNVEILLKAAKNTQLLGDTAKALSIAKDACDVYQNDHKLISAEKHMSQVLQMIIESNNWEMVIEWLRYETKVLGNRRDMYANSIFHCYLGEVVIYLYQQQYDEAYKRLQHYFEEDEDFARSDQYAGGKALINACNSDDDGAITKARKDWPIYKYMERDIALLVGKVQLNPKYVGYNRQDNDEQTDSGEKKDTNKVVDASDALADSML